MNNGVFIDINNISKYYALNASTERFHALKNINVRIENKSCIGIIGRNGSGKSTLLKILAGVVKPSSGTIRIKGKINSLLDIGSNFIPDLSGLDNLKFFLRSNGVKSGDIPALTKEIHDFSGVKDFLHEPVKNYSSGMFLRLGLSACFHISADIILVDEIISAGDAEFREKVNSRFKSMIREGAVVVLASHNPEEIMEVCSQCIWLDSGEMKMFGPTSEAVDTYYKQLARKHSESNYFIANNNGNEKPVSNEIESHTYRNDLVEVIDFAIIPVEDKGEITYDNGFMITMKVKKLDKGYSIHPAVIIYDIFMKPIMMLFIPSRNELFGRLHEVSEQECILTMNCVVPGGLLSFGIFYAELGFGKNVRVNEIYTEEAYTLPEKLKFEVLPGKSFDFVGGTRLLFIKPQTEWHINTDN